MVYDFWKYHATLVGEFQAFISDFRSMTKHGNSVKPNMHDTKVALSLAPYKKRIKTTMTT